MSFTLYPAPSTVVRGNMALRYSVSHFSQKHCVLNSTPGFCLGARANKIFINNNSFPRVQIELTTVTDTPLCPAPRRPQIFVVVTRIK